MHYSVIFSRRNTALIMLGSCLCILSIASPPLYGWASYGFDNYICFVLWRRGKNYLLLVVTIGFVIPCCVMTLTNALIFRQVRQSSNKVHVSNSGSVNRKNDIKLAKSMVVIILGFICTMSLYTILIIIDAWLPDISIAADVRILSVVLGCSNSAINPLIYGAMNGNVKRR